MLYLISVQDPLPVDLQVSLALQRTHAYGLAHILLWVSGPGYMPWSMTIIIGCGALIWRWLGRGASVYFVILSGLQALLNTIIKDLIARPRPDISQVWVMRAADGYSFPSGHVMFYTISFGFLLYLLYRHMPRSWKRFGLNLLLWGFVLLVGVSRIFLGAHWLSDVVAGYMIGIIYLGWAIEFYRATTRIAPTRAGDGFLGDKL